MVKARSAKDMVINYYDVSTTLGRSGGIGGVRGIGVEESFSTEGDK